MMKKWLKGMALAATLVMAMVLMASCSASDADRYAAAVKLYEEGKLEEAEAAFKELVGYEQADTYVAYMEASKLLENGDFATAATALNALGDFQNAATLAGEATAKAAEAAYATATDLMGEAKFTEAAAAYEAAGSYSDAAAQKAYAEALQLAEDGQWDEAVTALEAMTDIEEASTQIAYYAARRAESEDRLFDAATGYEALGSFRDSETRLAAVQTVIDEQREAKFQIGNQVRFGHYEQDNDRDNAGELIEWIVIARDGKKALLLSLNAIEAQPYHTEWTDVDWQNSSLHAWLNSTFVDGAFTVSERSALVANEDGDLVFCLSEEEAAELSETDRIGTPTDLAVAHGAAERENGGTAWWLRTTGRIAKQAAVVNGETIDSHNVNVSHDTVRPAIWVQIDSGLFD